MTVMVRTGDAPLSDKIVDRVSSVHPASYSPATSAAFTATAQIEIVGYVIGTALGDRGGRGLPSPYRVVIRRGGKLVGEGCRGTRSPGLVLCTKHFQ
ncbi:hypothetical protein B5M45_30980 [Mycobacterium simiae]|uniref:Uncharacterized protein n=1 Tax=Mycobacterium simiae TaxID=1784 RepID=A0A1X0XIB2_MYCSI|nr:hypothetical protein B5M45_30980 [Mycobacterium simiae]